MSIITQLLTTLSTNDYIDTPTATPVAFGDALEGGFYAGMIWNEVVESSTSTTIGTGNKTFTVASMTGSPLFYAGQTVEVRSRANPNNKMIGTVASASGTSLGITVSSGGGSGTFTDWSIMSRYRIIVAPKATGEAANLAYKNDNTAAPAACITLTEGRKATLAMVAAGTSTVYPAAHWCNNLNIAGKTDWYLPARDELELCWRNLKPGTHNNYDITRGKANSAYANLGSYTDTSESQGANANSWPVGSAYTLSIPAQVAAGKNFRTGETEAFAYGSIIFVTSSEGSATATWTQYWYAMYAGGQVPNPKTTTYYVRAVRRSII